MTVHRETGPLADEAAFFVAAALSWAQRAAGAIDPTGERFATGAPECSACPVCRTVGALRDPSPELAERLTHTVTEMATVLAAGLRFAFDGPHAHGAHQDRQDRQDRHEPPSEHAAGDDHPHPAAPQAPHQRGGVRHDAPTSGVEHIDIS